MKRVILFFLVLASFSSMAQTLSGTLIDEQEHPLSFVAFSNIKTKIGGYSDDAGKFSIDVSGLGQTDEVVFSHLGYVDIKMTVAQLTELKTPIKFQAKNYSLHEVVVGPGDAKSMLMDALARIKDNYPAEFSNNHIIFKDYSVITGERNHYYNFDFNMYIPSYLAKDSPRIYTVDHKHEMYEKKGSLFNAQLKPTMLLKLMYPERLFSEKMMKENDFQMATTTTTIDGEEYDVIEFHRNPQKGDHSIAARGHAYINRNDKGIRFIDVHVYNEKPSRFMLVAKMDTLNINAKVAYIKVDGKYMLDYISQTTYASGKFFGSKQNLVFSSTARVIERQIHLKMNEIIMKTEVDDIFTNEKPKDIKELKAEPDMK
jgi:hypothetical protein